MRAGSCGRAGDESSNCTLKETSREKVLRVSCGSMRARRDEKLVELPGRRACRAPGRGACRGPGRGARQNLRGVRQVELREILCFKVLARTV